MCVCVNLAAGLPAVVGGSEGDVDRRTGEQQQDDGADEKRHGRHHHHPHGAGRPQVEAGHYQAARETTHRARQRRRQRYTQHSLANAHTRGGQNSGAADS